MRIVFPAALAVSLLFLLGLRGGLILIDGVPIMVAAWMAAVPIVILSPSSSAPRIGRWRLLPAERFL